MSLRRCYSRIKQLDPLRWLKNRRPSQKADAEIPVAPRINQPMPAMAASATATTGFIFFMSAIVITRYGIGRIRARASPPHVLAETFGM